MQVKVTSNFGHFAYTASADIADGLSRQTYNTIRKGIADTCFRAVGSNVEKALVKAKLMNGDDKRSEVKYSEEAAGVVATTAQEVLNKMSGADAKEDEQIVPIDFEVTGEHTFGDTASPMKRATALVDTFIGTPMEAAYRTVLGVAADVDRAGLIAAAHAKGLGIQPPKA